MRKKIIENKPIDFVITWVDGSDKEWLKEKNKYLFDEKKIDSIDSSSSRYRDWGTLKYLFRGIEKFTPWVNKVYLITNGQCPNWLNLSNDKVKLVTHKEYMPAEYLPTFSSHPIELNLHRINDLSEQFVLFNDDTFIVDNMKPEDFFKKGLPCDSAVISPIIAGDESTFAHILINNIRIINMHFNKKTTLKNNFSKYYTLKYGKNMLRTIFMKPWKEFVGFYNHHLPNSFLKSTLAEVWEKQPKELHETSLHRFRNHYYDVNQWLFRYWQLASGQFTPRKENIGRNLKYGLDDDIMYKCIREKKYKIVCLNDDERSFDFDSSVSKTHAAFDSILPEKSSFEL